VFVTEALFHFQLTQGRFRPYVGGGAGLALVNLFDRTFNAVVTAASGLRADLTPRWGVRLEADLRISGFEAGSVGWGLGIARRF
jgi:outer membrane protein W